MQLRPYQKDAFERTIEALNKKSNNALIVIPTGGGKTAIMSFLCQYIAGWGGRCIVLSHVKELIEQTYETLKRFDKNLDVGIYSAGLNRRDAGNRIVCGQIQTVFQKAKEIGKETVLIIDEAHLIPKSENSRYRTFLNDMLAINPKVKLVGLTATPYRMDEGLIYGKDELFTGITYEAKVTHLIEKGYLSKLRSKNGSVKMDESLLTIDKGEFDTDSQEKQLIGNCLLGCAQQDIWDKCKDRKKILVFCPNIKTCNEFKDSWNEHFTGRVEVITGETSKQERPELIDDFRDGKIRILVNCQVLTTGFDVPDVDCVVLLRATQSVGLYYQMVGRGLRKAEGKDDCLILDYGRNIERHGPINDLREIGKRKRGGGGSVAPIAKECPECQEVVPARALVCPVCGYEFPKPEPEIETKASEKPVIQEVYEEEFEVLGAEYSEPREGKEPGDRYIMVYYTVKGYRYKISDFIGVEYHKFWQKKNYREWFKKHVDKSILDAFGGQIPDTCGSFEIFVRNGAIAVPTKIKAKLKEGEKHWKITGETIDHKPTLEEVNAKMKAKKEEVSNPDSYYYTGY